MRNPFTRDYVAVAAACGLVVAAFVVQGFFIIPAGDDIVYSAYDAYYGGSPLYYPRWILRHWWLFNGRAANYLTPALLYFAPRWLLIVLNGLVTGLYVWMVAWFVHRRHPSPLAGMVTVALLMLTMAWWDTSTMFDVAFNYVWASCFGLVALWIALFCRLSGWRLWAACGFSLIAGMMHEAMAVPLAFGLAVYCLQQGLWRSLPRSSRLVIAWFAAGAVICLVAPGIWRRFSEPRVPDDPMWLVLLKSDYYGIALLVAVAAMAAVSPARLRELCRSRWVIFAAAAFASSCFCAVGGIVGRSGWFAQTYSIVALAWMLPPVKGGRMARVASTWALLVLVAASLAATTVWQIKVGRQGQQALEAFKASPDGTFYMDCLTIDDVPWWTLKRPRGAIPNNDASSRWVMNAYYNKPYVMLPAALRNVDLGAINGEIAGDGWIVSVAPKGERIGHVPYQALWRDTTGRLWAEVKFSRDGYVYFLSTPAAIHPGDRFPI